MRSMSVSKMSRIVLYLRSATYRLSDMRTRRPISSLGKNKRCIAAWPSKGIFTTDGCFQELCERACVCARARARVRPELVRRRDRVNERRVDRKHSDLKNGKPGVV